MHRERLKKWIIGIFLIFFIVYGLFESYKIISGPKISITNLKNGEYFESPLIEVKGVARHISFISLNDRPIFIDKEGAFFEKLILLPGYNIMSLKAKDRFGKAIEEKMEFYLKRPVIPETATSSPPEIENTSTTTATTTTEIDSEINNY